MNPKKLGTAFVGIYKHFCHNRGIWLPLLVIFAVLNIIYGSFVIFTSWEGIMAWLYLIYYPAIKRRVRRKQILENKG